VKHWGVWGDYAKSFRMTKRMEDDLAIANPWVEKNERLFKELSNVLRMVDPTQYVHCRNGFQELWDKEKGPDGNPLKPIGGIWHTLALNMGQVRDASKVHLDWKDNKSTFNCVVPWGSWKGGDMILWPLKMRIQIQEGEGFMFLGGLIAHSVTMLTDGMISTL